MHDLPSVWLSRSRSLARVCWLGLLPGCTEPPPAEGRLRFADGTTILEAIAEPDPLRPGQPLEVTLDVEGEPETVVVGLLPPLTASRQVARGGPQAPPAEIEADERSRLVTVSGGGHHRVSLPVPEPWHPRTAVVTVEVLRDEERVAAVSGPRTHAGIGIALLLPVAPRPTVVRATRTGSPPTIDGVLDDAIWSRAEAVPLVESREGEPSSGDATLVWFAWDESALYVAARLPDRDVWSNYTRQDEPLWKEEVFEVFVFGDAERRDYLELQLSPRGVTFDARFERYRKGDEAWDSTWSTAVSVQGTVDERSDIDEGWTAEVAIPWEEICAHASVRCPPVAGNELRVNTFRLERPEGGTPIGLALSPTRVPDFHAPENAAIVELLP